MRRGFENRPSSTNPAIRAASLAAGIVVFVLVLVILIPLLLLFVVLFSIFWIVARVKMLFTSGTGGAAREDTSRENVRVIDRSSRGH